MFNFIVDFKHVTWPAVLSILLKSYGMVVTLINTNLQFVQQAIKIGNTISTQLFNYIQTKVYLIDY